MFDDEEIARALEAKGRPIAAAITRGFLPARRCEHGTAWPRCIECHSQEQPREPAQPNKRAGRNS